MDRLKTLYAATFGYEPESINPISGAGSNRRYYRLGTSPIVVGTIGTDKAENDAFFSWDKYFINKRLPVPNLIAKSDEGEVYLQENVGDVSLYDMIVKYGVESPEVREIMVKCMERLPEFQLVKSSDSVDWERCYPRQAMDLRAVMWDLNYFKYCFLKISGIEIREDALENDFECFAQKVLTVPDNTIMLRDFQSRNVMVRSGEPYVIDFQGARRGAALYDVASFLWQVRAGIPDSMRMELAEVYRKSLESLSGVKCVNFHSQLRLMALFRTMQVLGAYGFRGYVERKAQFITEISGAVRNLTVLLDEVDLDDMPYLKSVLREISGLPRFSSVEDYKGLTVKVMSFSYKKGIPEDYSGNGGGFVFDCRAVHNPGRYDEYKKLTGLDAPVIEFIERDGEMVEFMEDCYRLVDRSVECYVRRGFSSLMVCFGCTGGQHRSVYGASHMAEHIWRKFGVRVELVHREQGKSEIFGAL